MLPTFAVVGDTCERSEVDVVDTPDIDRDHLAAIRAFAAANRLDTAILTKEMGNDFLVETILL